MLKKILKYTVRTLIVLLLLPFLVGALLYIPGVQNFIRRQAEIQVERHLGMELSIGRIRLSFPLRLVITETMLREQHDTLLQCGRFALDVDPLPLLRRQVDVRKLQVEETRLNYRDSISGMSVSGSIGSLTLRTNRIDLATREIDLREIDLSQSTIDLTLGASTTSEAPDTTTAPATWRIGLGRLDIGDTDVALRLEPGPTEIDVHLTRAAAEECNIDMGLSTVGVGKLLLDRGAYAYRTAPTVATGTSGADNPAGNARAAGVSEQPLPADEASAAVPWDIRVGRIELIDNRVEYTQSGHRPAEGFDPAAIELAGLSLVVDSLHSQGSRLAMRIASLQFVERSGFAVNDLCAGFSMGPDSIRLDGLRITTPKSEFRADMYAGASLLDISPSAPIEAELAADASIEELALFAPALAHPALQGLRLRLVMNASGRLADIDPLNLEIASPGHLRLTASGSARNLPDMDRAEVTVRFGGLLRQLGFLEAMLPDTALRRRIELPAYIGLQGHAGLNRGTYALQSSLEMNPGALSVDAAFNPATERYRAEVTIDSLPLGDLLPHDSLGSTDVRIDVRGRGFDPLSARTEAHLETAIGHLPFRGHDFGGIALEAALEQGALSGRLIDRDTALRMELALDGSLSEERQQIAVRGTVEGFDLAALGVTPDSIGGSFTIDALAGRTATDSLAARIDFDRINLYGPQGESPIRPTGASFSTAPSGTRASLRSGDLSLAFESPAPLDSLTAAMGHTIDSLRQQIGSRGLDMEQLQPLLPGFRLRGKAGSENIVNNFLRTKQLSFEKMLIDAGNGPGYPLAFDLRINGLAAASFTLDTLAAGIARRGQGLEASLRAVDRAAHSDSVARTSLETSVALRTARIMLRRDAPGEVPVRFGTEAAWNENEVTVRVLPDLGSWQVNPENFLTYDFDRTIRADLDITRGAQRFALHTVELPDLPGAIRLDIAGIDIARTLRILPSAPPLGGRLGTGITFGMSPDSLSLRATVAVDSLSYDGERFGDIALHAGYDRGRGHKGSVKFSIDDAEVLAVEGAYRIGEPQSLDVVGAINDLPLQRLNVFLPQEMLRLAGTLGGRIQVGGSPDKPLFDGDIRLAKTEIRVPMIGTSFRIPADTIRLAGNRVDFGDFAILPPNNNPLTISGAIDFADLGHPAADLRIRARNFQFLNVARRERTAVYGSGFLNLDASARGPLDEMVVRGNVALLRGTEINYVMQDTPTEIEQQSQDVVSFVSFDEEDAATPAAPAASLRIGGLDLLFNIDISEDVSMGVDLSADGSNRIDLRGGGNLSYAMNPLGDIAFSGKYTLSGGTVRYNPPVISQKVFAIRPGSYVEWTGNIADPSFDITAVETVRANVTSDDNQSRPVNFEISVNIRNSLNDLAVSFGLAAPEDLTMQNQLQSLTEQQRAMQAMNLLIYNTYTGPGTTAKVNTENPLNAFVQKELNQWAQNSLRGVDLSFGIDSYDQTDPNGARTDYSYRLSKKLFGNRVQISIGGKFSTGTDPSENLKENMIDDISLEYLLTKRGNMLVRLFRHTGYESILEGEITETGVGFIIRKKMSRLGDLFRSQRRQEKKATTNETDTH